MFYAVTNHLFPKPEFVERFVRAFAGSAGRPITEHWDSPRFEMRRPLDGDEWLSTSLWPSAEKFDDWRNSEDIRRDHANTNVDSFSRRALLSFHDVVMNAAPGRAPVIGQPARYPRLGVGKYILIRHLFPKPEHADDVINAFAAAAPPATPGWGWWDFWKLVKGDAWWSICYFDDRAAADAALDAGAAYLTDAGRPDWYEKPGYITRHELELERIPGMSATDRVERELVSA